MIKIFILFKQNMNRKGKMNSNKQKHFRYNTLNGVCVSTISHRGLLFWWDIIFLRPEFTSFALHMCVWVWIELLCPHKTVPYCCEQSKCCVLHFWWNSNSKVKWKYLLSAISSIFVILFDQHISNDFFPYRMAKKRWCHNHCYRYRC